MNVTVSVLGRFHAFYLARELERRKALDRLVTTYPKWAVARWGVSRQAVRSLWPLEVGRRVLPRSLRRRLQRSGALQSAYDRLASRCISERSDLVVAWSGSAERTLQRARESGARRVLERCSSHMRVQERLLREEYERLGLEPDVPSPAAVEREEREYDEADRIAIPSSFVERTFLDQGVPAEKLMRIPYGVDTDEFRPIAKEDEVFRVVYAGSLGVRKGTLYLLKAFSELDLPRSELLLLGTVREEAKPWLKEYGEHVRHPGHVPQHELYRWYSQGSVFVMPSIEEGMAYVQLQAMACGLPLICTPHTGGEDLIEEGEHGFVVPVRDVEALQEKLEWAFVHQDRCRAMGDAARKRVLKNFTWREYGKRVARAYRASLRG